MPSFSTGVDCDGVLWDNIQVGDKEIVADIACRERGDIESLPSRRRIHDMDPQSFFGDEIRQIRCSPVDSGDVGGYRREGDQRLQKFKVFRSHFSRWAAGYVTREVERGGLPWPAWDCGVLDYKF